jgi:sugar diacid utilization regulator
VSCQQALAALEAGLRLRRTHQVLLYEDAVLEVMLLANREASRRLISGYLASLGEHPLLDETIHVYIELGQSAQATAGRLVVHVNTIAYRLRRISELTGHDIRNPGRRGQLLVGAGAGAGRRLRVRPDRPVPGTPSPR